MVYSSGEDILARVQKMVEENRRRAAEQQEQWERQQKEQQDWLEKRRKESAEQFERQLNLLFKLTSPTECPHCGAPRTGSICEYCGARL